MIFRHCGALKLAIRFENVASCFIGTVHVVTVVLNAAWPSTLGERVSSHAVSFALPT